MQYSANTVESKDSMKIHEQNTEVHEEEEDEDEETEKYTSFLAQHYNAFTANSNVDQTNQYLGPNESEIEEYNTFFTNHEYRINVTTTTCKAHTEYWSMLANMTPDLCIPDGGADSHVGGKTWLPLTPISGNNIKYANVTGFDENSAKKFGLPIIAAIAKVTTREGISIILRAKHMIYNGTSSHTLLSTYQMREVGLIVDDVSKRHWKDRNSTGTQSIISPNGNHVINLITKGALNTFQISKPTIEEYANTPEEKYH